MIVPAPNDVARWATHKRASRTDSEGMLKIAVCESLTDNDWDRFVESVPRGHHVQSSLWASVKAQAGWQSLRLIAARDGQIRGGVQVLLRRTRFLGLVGYAPKGPVTSPGEPNIAELLLEELDRVAAARKIRLIAFQPPSYSSTRSNPLPESWCSSFPFELAPTATVEVDLSKDLEALLADMKPKARYNIRLSKRKGVTVRPGVEEELPVFHSLLCATASRQGFAPESLEFYRTFWRIFSPHGHVKLFIAEYSGEPISALLAVTFGGTVLYKRGGWSGRCGECRPNEAMHWFAIQWAHSHGYRYYDFEGISRSVAQAVLDGRAIPESASQTLDRFKLGFGGKVVLSSEPMCFIRPKLARFLYEKANPILRDSSALSSFIYRARN